MDIDFIVCPECNGYGVRDSGVNCKNCGGVGTGGLHSTNGIIGSGEIMRCKETGRRITLREFRKLMAATGKGE